MAEVLVLNLPGRVLKAGSRWYNKVPEKTAQMKYYPYPWFMGYLVSLLKSHKIDVDFKDAVAMEWSFEHTLDYIAKTKPRYIFCEPTYPSIDDDKKLIGSLGKNIVKVSLGNFSTTHPFTCLDIGFDYAIMGEYEFAILEFLEQGGKELPINFVSTEKTEYEFPQLVEDLDLFPFPERDLTPIEYYNEPSCFGVNIVVVSSRGCRLRCSFCNVESFYGKHVYRTRSPRNVVDEMEFLKRNYRFDEIYFDDDNMASSKEHLVGICDEIIRRNLKVPWLCMGDGLVDDETLEMLAKSGCTTYKFGAEHYDKEVLRAIPKTVSLEKTAHIIGKCRELGMKSYLTLMIGLPKSTWEKDLAMVKQTLELRPDLVQFAIATPYPGTSFYEQAIKEGWLVGDDPTHFDVSGRSVVSYPDYSWVEITAMYNLAWKMWHRHVILRQPSTLKFFFLSNIRREGLVKTFRKSLSYFIEVVSKRFLNRVGQASNHEEASSNRC
jgi:radical SAM superfamily enzyme YgiQ (UPF0313 family)